MSTINKKRMDNLIPMAIDVVKGMDAFFEKEQQGGQGVKSNKISKTYHGYFSSFGADMINSTPLAAIIFFEETEKTSGARSKEDKSLIPKSILALIKKERPNEVTEQMKKLSDYYTRDKAKIANITVAAAALKIALRTFPKS